MTSNKRIHNRFEYWSVDDCACVYCINYKGKKRPCPLDTCCIEDIRQEAIRREAGGLANLSSKKERRIIL